MWLEIVPAAAFDVWQIHLNSLSKLHRVNVARGQFFSENLKLYKADFVLDPRSASVNLRRNRKFRQIEEIKTIGQLIYLEKILFYYNTKCQGELVK